MPTAADLLDQYPPPILALTEDLRTLVKKTDPMLKESVRLGWQSLLRCAESRLLLRYLGASATLLDTANDRTTFPISCGAPYLPANSWWAT